MQKENWPGGCTLPLVCFVASMCTFKPASSLEDFPPGAVLQNQTQATLERQGVRHVFLRARLKRRNSIYFMAFVVSLRPWGGTGRESERRRKVLWGNPSPWSVFNADGSAFAFSLRGGLAWNSHNQRAHLPALSPSVRHANTPELTHTPQGGHQDKRHAPGEQARVGGLPDPLPQDCFGRTLRATPAHRPPEAAAALWLTRPDRRGHRARPAVNRPSPPARSPRWHHRAGFK